MATDGLYKPPRAEPGAPETTLGTLCAGDAPDRPTAPSTTCHRDSRTPKPPKAAASRRLLYWVGHLECPSLDHGEPSPVASALWLRASLRSRLRDATPWRDALTSRVRCAVASRRDMHTR